MLLSSFRVELDSSTRRVILNIDGDSAYAIFGARDDFQAGLTRRVFNWLALNTLYPSYHGKASMDGDSYGTFMKQNYTILFDYRPNAVVLDVKGTPPVPWENRGLRRYDLGIWDSIAYRRDSFASDMQSYVSGWLATR